jgi:hypothetical protein
VARPRKAAPQLSAGQASYVLDRLVADRRVSAGDINRYLGEMHKEISSLEQRLQSLRNAAGAKSPAPRAARAARAEGAPAPKRAAKAAARKKALSPEQRASRQLQGRYLALVRQIPKSRRANYSRIAKEKGREAAIKEMTDALKK